MSSFSQSTSSNTPNKSHKIAEENRLLGQILSALRQNNTKITEENNTLKQQLLIITKQQEHIGNENAALREIVDELHRNQHKTEATEIPLHNIPQPSRSFHSHPITTAAQQQYSVSASPANAKNDDISRLIADTNHTMDAMRSTQRQRMRNGTQPQMQSRNIPLQTNNTPPSDVTTENEIHCLRREIHKIEMEKLDLLEHNRYCIEQLRAALHNKLMADQRISHLESEIIDMRSEKLRFEESVLKQLQTLQSNGFNTQSKLTQNMQTSSQNQPATAAEWGVDTIDMNSSFSEIIKQVKAMEMQLSSVKELQKHINSLNCEMNTLKETISDKDRQCFESEHRCQIYLEQYSYIAQKLTNRDSEMIPFPN